MGCNPTFLGIWLLLAAGAYRADLSVEALAKSEALREGWLLPPEVGVRSQLHRDACGYTKLCPRPIWQFAVLSGDVPVAVDGRTATRSSPLQDLSGLTQCVAYLAAEAISFAAALAG